MTEAAGKTENCPLCGGKLRDHDATTLGGPAVICETCGTILEDFQDEAGRTMTLATITPEGLGQGQEDCTFVMSHEDSRTEGLRAAILAMDDESCDLDRIAMTIPIRKMQEWPEVSLRDLPEGPGKRNRIHAASMSAGRVTPEIHHMTRQQRRAAARKNGTVLPEPARSEAPRSEVMIGDFYEAPPSGTLLGGDMFSWDLFEVGDIVSRDGTDRHEVIAVSERGQMIEARCIAAPESGWCQVGDVESNLARRYSKVVAA